MSQNYFAKDTQSVFAELESNPNNGLSSTEAAQRLEQYGPNELKAKKQKSALMIFFSQFKEFMVIILIIAAIISAAVAQEYVDTIVILVLVIANAVIGTIQELKAEQSLQALEKMSAPNAKVLRNSVQISIPARELVMGDIVLLDAGDSVPADLRLIDYASLKINESALTGESVPVEKAEGLLPEDSSIGDRLNMAFSSSLVSYGRGKGIVVSTGMQTEVGKIASLIQDAPEIITPMQRRLNSVGKTLGIAALAVCAVMFLVGYFLYKREPLHMFMSAIALAVAAIPEGLPTISTMVLALGVQRMAKRNAIVRHLPSVETLGSATVICSDKTGTLTQNRMTVLQYALPWEKKTHSSDQLENESLIKNALLCTDAELTEEGAIGDPTEVALVEVSKKLGYDKSETEKTFPRVNELPFDSERKRMTTVHQLGNGKLMVYVKGGMDEILAVSTNIATSNGIKPLETADLERLNDQNEQMAVDALRVLAFASKEIDSLPKNENKVKTDNVNALLAAELESNLTFTGMLGMIDPPRPEAKKAVAACHHAGIRPVMITGDHKLTASAIAKELQILKDTDTDDKILTGKELEAMSDEQLIEKVEDISVYARVSPEHKVRIINAWQSRGDVVAMTGDGVNDAPALKRADIGCSMGKGGTDVAKDASDIILVDDNFATVVSAVEEGRRIFDNVLKSISFLLSCNVGEIITLFVATLFGWHEPLLPIHLLLVNLVTDGLPALALGVDPAEPDIMERKAKKSKSIFSRGLLWRMGYQGVMVGILTLLAYMVGAEWNPTNPADLGQAQTMAFAVLAMSQIIHSFNIRSKTHSIFKVTPWQNMKLIGAGLLSFIIVMLCINIPGLNTVLDLEPLYGAHILEVIILSLVPMVVVELMKLLKLNTSKEEKLEYNKI